MSYESFAAELITEQRLHEYRAAITRVEARPLPSPSAAPRGRRWRPSWPVTRVMSIAGRPSTRLA